MLMKGIEKQTHGKIPCVPGLEELILLKSLYFKISLIVNAIDIKRIHKYIKKADSGILEYIHTHKCTR